MPGPLCLLYAPHPSCPTSTYSQCPSCPLQHPPNFFCCKNSPKHTHTNICLIYTRTHRTPSLHTTVPPVTSPHLHHSPQQVPSHQYPQVPPLPIHQPPEKPFCPHTSSLSPYTTAPPIRQYPYSPAPVPPVSPLPIYQSTQKPLSLHISSPSCLSPHTHQSSQSPLPHIRDPSPLSPHTPVFPVQLSPDTSYPSPLLSPHTSFSSTSSHLTPVTPFPSPHTHQ